MVNKMQQSFISKLKLMVYSVVIRLVVSGYVAYKRTSGKHPLIHSNIACLHIHNTKHHLPVTA